MPERTPTDVDAIDGRPADQWHYEMGRPRGGDEYDSLGRGKPAQRAADARDFLNASGVHAPGRARWGRTAQADAIRRSKPWR